MSKSPTIVRISLCLATAGFVLAMIPYLGSLYDRHEARQVRLDNEQIQRDVRIGLLMTRRESDEGTICRKPTPAEVEAMDIANPCHPGHESWQKGWEAARYDLKWLDFTKYPVAEVCKGGSCE